MMKRYVFLLHAWLVAAFISAQTLTVNAPSRVATGENFRLTYTVNTQNASDFHVGNVPEELEIITGPYMSQQSSYQMINGHTSSSSSITYTFIICANKNGTYTIPPARVKVGDKTITSQATRISVSGSPRANPNGAPHMHEDDDNSHAQVRQAGSKISGNDLFIKVSANKSRVHEQEPILLTYKVYTLVELSSLNGNMPDLTGFHTQEIPLPQQKRYHVENVNGRPYRCVTWSQYVMYPQMTGDLEIPSITFDGTVIQQNRDVDPFEAFFNGGSGYIEVKRSIKAPGLKIKVEPLPARPANFSGGVGRLNLSAQLSETTVKANDPVTLRVVVSGTGNLKLIKQPVVNFPKDFDKYDAKVTDKTKLTVNGVEGNMVYDFLAVPRNHGKYTIPAVEFVYYDTQANAYKTLKSKPFELNVEKGSGSSSMTDYTSDLKNQDIRPLKTGEARSARMGQFFFGSTTYWLVLGALAAIFMALLIIFRKRAIDNANIGKMRGKKANKVAVKRLKMANKLMAQGQQGAFYDEVLRALWGYVGDKLNMPVEQLSRDNISDQLTSKGVDSTTISQFISALDECEFERYAPGDPAGNMNKTYDTAVNAIMRIEDALKAGRKPVKAGLLVMLLLCLATQAHAISKSLADAEYARGNYVQAIKDYEALLRQNASADIYYNLGNAYYRTDNITRAVINYERALLLSPGDEDIRFNLQMARSKTIDKITPESQMFFVTWYRSLVSLMSVDAWARLALISLAAALVLLLVYLFARRIALRKLAFFGAIALLVVFVAANLFAWQQRQQLTHRNGAIVVSPVASVKKTPAAGSTEEFVVHEGTRVDITDDTMIDWKGVRTADGKEGWMLTSQLEKI